MKLLASVLLIVLCGCVSTTADIADEPRYRSLTGQFVHLDRELSLYEAKLHQFVFTPYVLRKGKLSGRSDKIEAAVGRLIATVPAGAEIRVVAFKRQRGGDGHVWDYLLGELRLSAEAQPVSFEYLIGLTDEQRALPFSLK